MAKSKKTPSKVDQLIDELLEDCQSPEDVVGESGLLKQLSKRLIERSLAGELTHHLNATAPPAEATAVDTASEPPKNSRNGHSKKTIQTQQGEMEIDIPRDRAGTFEPVLVPKHERRLAGLDEKILALYARGNSTRDISAQLEEFYGVKLSAALISEVTDAVSDDVSRWQARPLASLYPIVYLDALYVNIRMSGQVRKQAVYVVLGITLDGNKEILGLWIGPGEAEGAKYWLKVLTDLKNRGLQDIFIACCDGLKGFPQAIGSVYPQTQVQLCIVHLIRNSMRYIPWKESRALAADLKHIYLAPSLEAAEAALVELGEKWDETYPIISQIWLRHWENIIPLFDYPMDIRRVIYTTNPFAKRSRRDYESVNRSLRKVIKTKGLFPDEASVYKLMYLALNNISKRWSHPIRDWKTALSRFAILFPDRFPF